MRRVVIAGGSGTVGQRLSQHLKEKSYEVKILTRNKELCSADSSFIHWDVEKGEVATEYFSADIVINLAGAGIADKRWTDRRKKVLLESRTKSSRLLIDTAIKNEVKFDHFISASAIGYYGDGGDRILVENSGVIKKEFLSDVCIAWEEESQRADKISHNTAIVRIGTVLSKRGGALSKMDQSIPFGIASYLGSGKQYMSWIHIDDLCRMIVHLFENNLSGIYNAVAPKPTINKDFMQILKDTLNSKAILVGTPAIALKLALGEMSRLVLNSSRVSSDKISKSGFNFEFSSLESALKDLYDR